MTESADPRTKLINNERAKLTATYLNGLAVAVFAVGGLAPIFSTLYGSTPLSVPLSVLTWSSMLCWMASGVLRLTARRRLTDLEP